MATSIWDNSWPENLPYKLGQPIGAPIDIRTQAYAARKNPSTAAQYFDYFYSGQDLACYIKGAPDYDLSIVQLGFSISQSKTPVYGFWDYVYSTVLHGTRIVQGQMVLNYRSQNYFMDGIAKAVGNKKKSENFLPSLTTTDQKNIAKYWNTTQLDSSTRDKLTKHLFVSHPPFDLVCVWGIQNQSLKHNPQQIEYWGQVTANTDWLSKDTNERLVDSGKEGRGRFAIVSIDLQSMALQTDPSGDPVTEAYSFIARDLSPVL